MNSDVQVRRSDRARAIRLRVDPRTGTVILTVPNRVSEQKARAWAAGQRDWIDAALARVPAVQRLDDGMEVPLYGLPHLIEWQPKGGAAIVVQDGRILVDGPRDRVEARLLRWLKRHALDILSRETAEYADKAGVTVSRVAVGDPVARWGSCSSAGAIRYSWRLILAPAFVRRATVAHEVAHRVHMNHSAQFHALVTELLGADPAPARAWLRAEGARLHRFGRF